jgi:predicted RNase H-like HicB family nuclease
MALEVRRGPDGRWIAEIADAGVVAYGATAEDAQRAALVLALRVVASRIEQGESIPDALVAAFAALEDVLEQSGKASTATRVLSTVLKLRSQLKRPILP